MNYTYVLLMAVALLVTSKIEKIIPNRPGIGLVTLPSMFLGVGAGVALSEEPWKAILWSSTGMVIILYHRYKSLHSDDSDTH